MGVEAETESEQLVLRFFATLSAGDLEGVRRMLHEQATWEAKVRSVPGAGVHRGPAGIVDEFLKPIRGLFRPGDPKILVDTIASRGNFVMIESHSGGTARQVPMPIKGYTAAAQIRERPYWSSFALVLKPQAVEPVFHAASEIRHNILI